MHKTQKTLIYKQARGTENLQTLVQKAIRKYSKPENRLEAIGADGSEVRFIAYARQHKSLLTGVFHKLTKGRAQQVIEMARNKDEWPVSAMSAKTSENQDLEFIEGTLFFALWQNHLVIHQNIECRADTLEQHLTWLLSRYNVDKAEEHEIPKSVLVQLCDPPPPDARKKSQSPVKEIQFGGTVKTKAVVPLSRAKGSTSTNVLFSPTGAVWKALSVLLGELKVKVPDDITLNESLSEDDVRISMKIFCSKKKSESGAGELLTVLGQQFRHSDAEYTVVLADKTTIKSDSMKKSKTVSVECEDHNPVHQSIIRSIVEYMEELVENGTIIDDEEFGNVK